MQLRMKEPYRKGVANRLASSLAEAVARLPSKRRQRNQRAGYGAAVCPEKEREKADVFSGR
jgi:hypothetical protein